MMEESRAGNLDELAGKYLTFTLDEEEYGVDILKVREIIGVMEITAVPHTPDYIKGVINLRGRVIPVIDLRLKFGMEARDYIDRTCIVVIEAHGDEGAIMVGLVVDSVSEVMNVDPEHLETTPSFGGKAVEPENILGMAKVEGEIRILLDVDNVISGGALEGLAE